METSPQLEPSFFQKNSTTLKGVLIFLLTLFLLIPANMVESLIYERESRRTEAVTEVSGKWGNSQTITGPVLVLPFEKILRDDKGKEFSREKKYAYFLPDELKINGEVAPETRHRGIFEVVVYKTGLSVEGNFSKLPIENVVSGEVNILRNEAFLACGIPDLRGLEDQVKLDWNGDVKFFEPGIPVDGVAESGVHVAVNVPSDAEKFSFKMNLSLRGSGNLMFTPLGKTTEIDLKSPWRDPGFSGAFLPTSHEITNDGFLAKWKVLNLNRNYPQAWATGTAVNFGGSNFGVGFLLPVDNYQKSTRSVKYAILFIGLTFLVVFFIEMKNSRRVHAFQYALIGLALVIFYTLLVSISEQMAFNSAYFIAAAMTVLLTGWYANSLFDSRKMGILVGSTLALLYGFLFVTLQLQDFALLFGSLGLFAILAAVMYFSRKIEF